MYLTNHNYLNNLGTGSPWKHFCQVIMKLVQWFLTRRFFKFSIKIYRENKPHPRAAMFFDNPNGLNNLGTESQRNNSAKLYSNWSSGFWQEELLSFLYRYIGKMSPAPWRLCFLTNPNGLNNLGRGSPKEHSCKIIWKSVQWFLTRLLKFST